MKNIYLLLPILILSACSNDNKSTPINISLLTTIFINLKDNQGNDLLNTENYVSNNIKIFYVNNSLATEINDTNLDNPKGFLIFTSGTNLKMKLFLNHNEEEFPITYIKWNATDTDTIKAHYYRTDSSVLLDKVWINNVLTTPLDSNSGIEFNILK